MHQQNKNVPTIKVIEQIQQNKNVPTLVNLCTMEVDRELDSRGNGGEESKEE